MPFWLGEAPARSDEMSAAVSKLRAAVDALLPGPEAPRKEHELEPAVRMLETDYFLERAAALQIARYLGEAKRALGVVPTTDVIALERFFDESGGMQLVLHAPFGSRVMRAWGLALRKKFCQGFNFELQAAATEEGLILSLNASHSFPLEEVFRYLNPNTVRETLTQAIIQSPIFETRWRWTSTMALAVPRNRGGVRIPNQLQRMYGEDLLQAVFPDAAACQDNLQGAREIPDHPLVNQALRDALEEAVDAEGLRRQLERLYAGEIQAVARDTPEPSVLSHELLNSAVYTFLDDAPLEERRTRAVYTRRSTEVRSADDLGALDPTAIERVRLEAWPIANTADEMYDALMVSGFIRESELAPHWPALLNELGARVVKSGDAWFAHERQHDELVDIVASRLEVLGPVTESSNKLDSRLRGNDIAPVLLYLEGQGRILRGRFTPGAPEIEWCDRRLLARIHRYTLSRLRAEIEPVTAADYMRFLMHWQHVAAEDQVHGADGLSAVIEQLEGFELAASAWEHDVLPVRVADYGGELIDQLCFSGRVAWGRITPGTRAPLRTSPIALMPREHAAQWAIASAAPAEAATSSLSSEAAAVREALVKRGASFFHELVSVTGLLPAFVERALAELAGAGIVTADSFAGLRALLARQDKRRNLVQAAGRWALLAQSPAVPAQAGTQSHDHGDTAEHIARALLKRYGVVFRSMLLRETRLVPWRELVRVYRRLEARGEIRGGRFVAGFGGEQFAASDAVGRLRAIRKLDKAGELIVISGADPLNLVGILTPEPRVPGIHTNRILLRDGLPIAALEAGELRRLAASDLTDDQLRAALSRRSLRQPAALHPRVMTARESTALANRLLH
jgi:ATP-dependent Lhr-like helicase